MPPSTRIRGPLPPQAGEENLTQMARDPPPSTGEVPVLRQAQDEGRRGTLRLALLRDVEIGGHAAVRAHGFDDVEPGFIQHGEDVVF